MITVRQASPVDTDQLALLNQAFNGVEHGSLRIRQSLLATSSPETVLVAEEAGTLIGFLCLQTLRSMCYDAPWVEITELYVAPSHRGRGTGQDLVREAEARAANAGAAELILRTNRENGPAQRLVSRIGLDLAPQMVFRRVYAGSV